MGTAAADLARYQYLPLNAFERVQLLNTVLIPRWMYRTLFLPNDSMFKAVDSMFLRFVLMAECMELNKVDVNKLHNVLHVISPHHPGGMGLHRLFWAHRARFTTMVTEHVTFTSGIHWLRLQQRIALLSGAYSQLPGYIYPAGCSHRPSHSTAAVAGRGAQPHR